MSSIVKINNQDLQVKEFNGQRVVTLKDIDLLHQRPEGTAKRNFNENRFDKEMNERFIKGIDYFHLSYEEARGTNFVQRPNSQGLTVLTESGYLMLVKSFTDDLAWEVQRQLVNSYFSIKALTKPDNMKVISLLHAEVGELIAATSQIETRVESLENNMTIDYGQQLVLSEIVKHRVIESMGGKESAAYKNSSLRSIVFSTVWKDYKDYFQVNSYRNTALKDFPRAKEYLEGWKVQGKILREIEETNGQIDFVREAK